MRSHSRWAHSMTLSLRCRCTLIRESKHNLMRSCWMNIDIHVHTSLWGRNLLRVGTMPSMSSINVTSRKRSHMMLLLKWGMCMDDVRISSMCRGKLTWIVVMNVRVNYLLMRCHYRYLRVWVLLQERFINRSLNFLLLAWRWINIYFISFLQNLTLRCQRCLIASSVFLLFFHNAIEQLTALIKRIFLFRGRSKDLRCTDRHMYRLVRELVICHSQAATSWDFNSFLGRFFLLYLFSLLYKRLHFRSDLNLPLSW